MKKKRRRQRANQKVKRLSSRTNKGHRHVLTSKGFMPLWNGSALGLQSSNT